MYSDCTKETPLNKSFEFLFIFALQLRSNMVSGINLLFAPLTKIAIIIKKLTFCPKYPNFGVKKAHFRHQGPIRALPIKIFNTKKASHWFLDMRVPKVILPSPQKFDFWPKNGQIWPNTGILGQISTFLAHLI